MPAAVGPTARRGSTPSWAWRWRSLRPEAGRPPDARRWPRGRLPAPPARTHPPRRGRHRPETWSRAFTPPAPDRLWLADITYLPTWEGFLYLAVVLDAFSRRVVGWSMADHLRAELVLDALDMALSHRRPAPGLVHHSDHGSQYTSLAFGRRCREAGIAISMGSVGDCYDNALAESFFATLECELVDRSTTGHPRRGPHGRLRLHRGLLQSPRRHSALGYLSPATYERQHTSPAHSNRVYKTGAPTPHRCPGRAAPVPRRAEGDAGVGRAWPVGCANSIPQLTDAAVVTDLAVCVLACWCAAGVLLQSRRPFPVARSRLRGSGKLSLWSDGGPGFPSDFPPPDAEPRGTGRNRRGRQVTADTAADRLCRSLAVHWDWRGCGGTCGEAPVGSVKSPALPTQVRILSLPHRP